MVALWYNRQQLGFLHTQKKPDTHTYLEKPFAGQVLYYLRKNRLSKRNQRRRHCNIQ